MQYKLTADINSNHPTEALSNLNDIVHFVDEVAGKYSSSNFVDEDDVPLLIEYIGPEDEYYKDNGDREEHSILTIATKKDDTYICNNALYNLGQLVRTQLDGVPYNVRARAYYHVNKTYTYLLVQCTSGELIHREQHEIISEKTFLKLPHILEEITAKEWNWHPDIGMFVCATHSARKMRPSDALATWIMHESKETVPF